MPNRDVESSKLTSLKLMVLLFGSIYGYEYGDVDRTYNQHLSDDRLCRPGVTCSSLGSCPLVRDMMHRSCFSTEKLRDFTCGYRGNEPMVCCPPGGELSPLSSSQPSYMRPSGLSQPQSTGGGCHPVEHVESTAGNWASRPQVAADSTQRYIRILALQDHQGQDRTSLTTTCYLFVGCRPSFGTSSSSHTELNVNCGQAMVRDTKRGGLGAHPWVVRVGFLNANTKKTSHVCLGSIISANVVLTSAYCASASDDVNFLSSVRVGEYDYKTDPDCNDSFCANPVQAYAIKRAIVHPDYDAKRYKHNVALLILNDTIQFNVAAQPVCILSNGQVPLLGRRGHLIGWGKSTNNQGQEVSPSQQQQIELPIIPLEECRKVYEQKVPITKEHLCMGGEGKRDACSGFTGGPYVLLDHYTFSKYYQVAILSFGSDRCGKDGTPSVYTSIHHYVDWISLNMK